MARLKALTLALGLLASLPAFATDAARPERKEVFGELTVHYNAFGSSLLQPAVAQASGLEVGRHIGMLNITLLRQGKPVTGNVQGTVNDLSGRKATLAFKPVVDKGSVSYIAQFPLEQADTYTFVVNIQALGASNRFSFNQELFPGP